MGEEDLQGLEIHHSGRTRLSGHDAIANVELTETPFVLSLSKDERMGFGNPPPYALSRSVSQSIAMAANRSASAESAR